jgi:hypothetical protein
MLDGFKLSDIKLMRNLQIVFFSLFIFYIIIKLFSSHSFFNSIYCDTDTIDGGSRPSTPTPTEGSRPSTPTPKEGSKGG